MTTAPETSWDTALLAIIEERDALRKAARAEALLEARASLDLATLPQQQPPARPGRPEKPELVPPQKVPRRGLGSDRGRAALLHALAHIELNAIDLAADMALRFGVDVSAEDRPAFLSDWMQVAGEEGLHFRLLSERLADFGTAYGDLPAHDGLWEAAQKTSADFLGRLAIAPMILEARGLDVTPGLIAKLGTVGDDASAAVLTRIYNDEIGHVRTGVRWFTHLVQKRGDDPEARFAQLVGQFYPSGPKPPFNVWARDQAHLPQDWYQGLVP